MNEAYKSARTDLSTSDRSGERSNLDELARLNLTRLEERAGSGRILRNYMTIAKRKTPLGWTP